ncbi:hypothetical protein T459_27477 [Capsicum annuum]|uniref:Uncharacterized protein n=1 Tax=Capsicum annuum TaxID=4072 RepID=A0A2G2YE19_CAPAN|nr:hypothetical protein FXO37_02178 [Capsicum annuum]PHT67990.1 hypothetical protein T459_27477 [Capsicum annuum]
MNLGFPIDFDGDKEDDASHRPNASTEEPENATGPTAFIGAFENRNAGAFEAEETESQQTNKQDEYSRRSSNVNEKEKCKRRKKRVENDNKTS